MDRRTEAVPGPQRSMSATPPARPSCSGTRLPARQPRKSTERGLSGLWPAERGRRISSLSPSSGLTAARIRPGFRMPALPSDHRPSGRAYLEGAGQDGCQKRRSTAGAADLCKRSRGGILSLMLPLRARGILTSLRRSAERSVCLVLIVDLLIPDVREDYGPESHAPTTTAISCHD